MPKSKECLREKVKKWLESVDKNVFQQHPTEDDQVFCRVCGKTFICNKKNHVQQHASSPAHKLKATNTKRQTFLPVAFNQVESNNSQFNIDLCEAFISSNIPLYKLTNSHLVSFLEKYCQRKIPSESLIRKTFLGKFYDQIINKIREDIGKNYIWLSVDETTDIKGRFIANMIVCKLHADDARKPFLLSTKQITKTNNETMARFVNDSLCTLWPNGIQYENVKLFITDGAPYMLKCGMNLKIFYKNLIHITCFAHGLNRVCESIRNQYDNVNGLIANVKKIFLKAPLRVETYKENLPEIPLPPEPVLTRWGTWIDAVVFYSEHFSKIKEVVLGFDKNCAKSIEQAQYYFCLKNVKHDIDYINAHFKILSKSIKKLETFGMPLTESYKIIADVKIALETSPGKVGKLAYEKFTQVISKNPGAKQVHDLAEILNGEAIDSDNLNPEIMSSLFKFCPITSCDVERSFSAYKSVLTEKRTCLTAENLEQYLVCYDNSKLA